RGSSQRRDRQGAARVRRSGAPAQGSNRYEIARRSGLHGFFQGGGATMDAFGEVSRGAREGERRSAIKPCWPLPSSFPLPHQIRELCKWNSVDGEKLAVVTLRVRLDRSKIPQFERSSADLGWAQSGKMIFTSSSIGRTWRTS